MYKNETTVAIEPFQNCVPLLFKLERKKRKKKTKTIFLLKNIFLILHPYYELSWEC